MAKVGVLGAGSWGTALAILLHDNGHDVTVWSIDPKEVEMLSEKREHVSKLPGVHISEEIMITNEMEEAIKGKDFLVLAVPSIFTRSTAAKMKQYVVDGQMIVDVAKGIEEDTLMTLSQQISQEIPQADVAVLSGPTHAEEVGRKLPTSCVIGAKTKRQQSTCSLHLTVKYSVCIQVLTCLESSLEVLLRMSSHLRQELQMVSAMEIIQRLL